MSEKTIAAIVKAALVATGTKSGLFVSYRKQKQRTIHSTGLTHLRLTKFQGLPFFVLILTVFKATTFLLDAIFRFARIQKNQCYEKQCSHKITCSININNPAANKIILSKKVSLNKASIADVFLTPSVCHPSG